MPAVFLFELSRTFLSFQGKRIKCSPSQVKHRLFIGNVPKDWTVEDMKKVVAEVGPGVTSVELLKVRHRIFYYMLCGLILHMLFNAFDFHVTKTMKCIAWGNLFLDLVNYFIVTGSTEF